MPVHGMRRWNEGWPMLQPSRTARRLALRSLLALVLLCSSEPRASGQGAPAPATPDNASSFIGDWTLTLQGQDGPGVFALTVKVVDGKVVGEITSEGQPPHAITDIKKSDTSLLLRYTFDYQGMAVSALVTLKPDGEKVAAVIDFADGAYLMSGAATKKK